MAELGHCLELVEQCARCQLDGVIIDCVTEPCTGYIGLRSRGSGFAPVMLAITKLQAHTVGPHILVLDIRRLFRAFNTGQMRIRFRLKLYQITTTDSLLIHRT